MKKNIFILCSILLLIGCATSSTQYMAEDCQKDHSYCQGMVYGAVRAYQALARAHYVPSQCIPQRANIADITKIYTGIIKTNNDPRLATSAGVLKAIVGYSSVMHCSQENSFTQVEEQPITSCQGTNTEYCRGVVIGIIDAIFLTSKISIPQGCIPSTWNRREMEKIIRKFKETPSTGENVVPYVTSLWLTNDTCGLRQKLQ